jgi:hypothetical protein
MNVPNLPGFSAQNAIREASNRSPFRRGRKSTNGVILQVGGSVYRMCCPSGDCDSTFCPNNDGAHVTCTNGKANTSCNNPTPCFLTTACTAARGLADDCTELAALRKVRDSYLMHSEHGRALVADYYRLAPHLCTLITLHPKSMHMYDDLYRGLVIPSVRLAEAGNLLGACDYYEQFTRELCNQFDQG